MLLTSLLFSIKKLFRRILNCLLYQFLRVLIGGRAHERASQVITLESQVSFADPGPLAAASHVPRVSHSRGFSLPGFPRGPACTLPVHIKEGEFYASSPVCPHRILVKVVPNRFPTRRAFVAIVLTGTPSPLRSRRMARCIKSSTRMVDWPAHSTFAPRLTSIETTSKLTSERHMRSSSRFQRTH